MEKVSDLNILVLGDVGSGRSSTVGHVFWNYGGLDRRTLERYEREAKESGKYELKYACIFQKLKEAWERDPIISFEKLFKFRISNSKCITFLDGPTQNSFITTTFNGISETQCTLFVVSAKKEEFELGFQNEQIKEMVLLSYILGVKQMIVVINKMDDKTVSFSEIRYKEIKNQVANLLKTLGYNVEEIVFIPISAWEGDNLIERSFLNMPWYNGPTLLEALNQISPSKSSLIEKSLRIPLQDIYEIGGIETILTGRIETGILKPGMNVIVAPSMITSQVQSIEMYFEKIVDQAIPGDKIGFKVKGIYGKKFHRGHVVGDPQNNPPSEIESFIAQIIVFNSPGQIVQISSQDTFVLNCHTSHVPCKFDQLISKMDYCRNLLEENPSFIKSGEAGIVKLIPIQPIVLEKFDDYPSLGRFTVSGKHQIIALGVIKEVTKKEKDNISQESNQT